MKPLSGVRILSVEQFGAAPYGSMFLADLGAEVTIVEMLPRILPVEDEDVSAFAHKAFAKQGMTIHVGAGVEKLEATKTGVKAAIKDKDGKVSTGDYSHAIVAVFPVPVAPRRV